MHIVIMHNIHKSLYLLVLLEFLRKLHKYLLIVTFSYTLTFFKAVVDQPAFPDFIKDTSLWYKRSCVETIDRCNLFGWYRQ